MDPRHQNLIRITNFVKYKSHVYPIDYGDFVFEAERNPQKFKKDYWAVNCALDRIPLECLLPIIEEHNYASNCVFFFNDWEIIDQYRHLNFRYFPYFIAEGIAQVRVEDELENPVIDFGKRKHLLSCANRIVRPHRVYNYYQLNQHEKLKHAAIGFTLLTNRRIESESKIEVINDQISLAEVLEMARENNFLYPDFENWFSEEYYRLPRSIEKQDVSDNRYANWLTSEAFTNSYSNIITETEIETFVPTEKVVKSLLAGCLFWTVSSKNFMHDLSKIGFDLDFQGIDYTQYDNQNHFVKRINIIAQMADDIYQDIEDVYHVNKHRLIYNRDLFFSNTLAQHAINDMTDIFELC